MQVIGLKTYFYTMEGIVPAVDGIDFELHKGETLAIAGESGCGKSVTALSILGLIPYPPGKILDGKIFFNNQNLLKLDEKNMRKIRGNEISMIFQEPMTSLNPVFSVGSQIMDSMMIHLKIKKKEARERTIEMIRLVEIPEPEKCIDRYPHQLSGGMRQRIMIAMALACNPKILLADEPTTALDVTIQAQILKLMNDLKKKIGTSIILITHDMGVVAQMAQKVMVMYAGKMAEYSDVDTIFENPLHPYTEGLLASIPSITSRKKRLFNIIGSIPAPTKYPKGCRFSSRCKDVMDICRNKIPGITNYPNGRKVSCWKYGEVNSSE